ncbi:hypothetical protein [Paraburkholderia phenoliruptrix]
MNVLELAADAGMLVVLDGRIGAPNTEASMERWKRSTALFTHWNRL